MARCYVGNAEKPLQGILQGNGAAPAIWAALSTRIINILRKLGGGVQGTFPITGEKLHIVSFSFVNDRMLPHAILGDRTQRPVQSIQQLSDL